MPNPFHAKPPKGRPPTAAKGHRPDATPEKTAAWPGLPGRAQPRTRDKAGTPKVRQSPKQEGL